MPLIKVRVAEIRRETADAVTLKLDLMGQRFDYKPGMAVEIDPHQFPELAPLIRDLEEKKGCPESPRGFSLASSPLDPGAIELSIKADKPRLFPPVLTPYILNRLKTGDMIELTGPAGRYTLPDPLGADIQGVIYIAAGSGVAPNRGIIKYCLALGTPLRHILFLQNKTPQDIFYRQEFDDLTRHYAGTFKIVHVLSNPSHDWKGHRGHLTLDLIRAELAGTLDPHHAIAFACGPNRPAEIVHPETGKTRKRAGFLETFAGNPKKNLRGILHELGVPAERIRTEMW